MAPTLLVADEDVLDAAVVERVVGGEVRPSGKAEYDLDTLGLETLDQGVDGTHRCGLLSGLQRDRRKPESSGEELGRSGVLELRPAARAQRVVHRNDAPAGGAAAMGLVVLVAVQRGGDEAEERDARRDEEPDEERRALELADDPACKAEREGDDQIGQAFHRTVSSAAWRPPR